MPGISSTLRAWALSGTSDTTARDAWCFTSSVGSAYPPFIVFDASNAIPAPGWNAPSSFDLMVVPFSEWDVLVDELEMDAAPALLFDAGAAFVTGAHDVVAVVVLERTRLNDAVDEALNGGR